MKEVIKNTKMTAKYMRITHQLKQDIQHINNIYEQIVRVIFALTSLSCIICDVIVLTELKQVEEEMKKKDNTDYQFDFFLIILFINLGVGHLLGLTRIDNKKYPKGQNKIFTNTLKIITRFLNIFGLSHIPYLLISGLGNSKSLNLDKFYQLTLGPRSFWAHWHSIISLFFQSHYMFAHDTHSQVVILGFISNVLNVIFSFIDYTDYKLNIFNDHINCEHCRCMGNENMKNKKEFENQNLNQSQKIKLKIDQKIFCCNQDKDYCVNFNRNIRDEPNFYYCGCKKHLVFICSNCYEIEKHDHTKISTLRYIWNQNFLYFMLIPEVIGKPLFFGVIAMIYIPESTITDRKPIRFAYDFFIWDCIALLGILIIPYMYYNLRGRNQSNQITSLLAFYVFYFTQFLKTPLKDNEVLKFTQGFIVLKDNLDLVNHAGKYKIHYLDPSLKQIIGRESKHFVDQNFVIDTFLKELKPKNKNPENVLNIIEQKQNSQRNQNFQRKLKNHKTDINTAAVVNRQPNKQNTNEIRSDITTINKSQTQNKFFSRSSTQQVPQMIVETREKNPSLHTGKSQTLKAGKEQEKLFENIQQEYESYFENLEQQHNENYSIQVKDIVNEVRSKYPYQQYDAIFNYLMSDDDDQSEKMEIIIKMIPRIIVFLGYFPLIWRVLEITFLICFIIFQDSVFVDGDTIKEQNQYIVAITLIINIISIGTQGYFLKYNQKLRNRIIKINKKFENNPEFANFYREQSEKQHQYLIKFFQNLSVLKNPDSLLNQIKQQDPELVKQLFQITQKLQDDKQQQIHDQQIYKKDDKGRHSINSKNLINQLKNNEQNTLSNTMNYYNLLKSFNEYGKENNLIQTTASRSEINKSKHFFNNDIGDPFSKNFIGQNLENCVNLKQQQRRLSDVQISNKNNNNNLNFMEQNKSHQLVKNKYVDDNIFSTNEDMEELGSSNYERNINSLRGKIVYNNNNFKQLNDYNC